MKHRWEDTKPKGDAGEEEVYQYLLSKWHVVRADKTDQLRGTDFLLTHRITGKTTTVEVKTCYVAYKTGNAFIETIQNTYTKHEGWALTCQAEFLWYYSYYGLPHYPHKVIFILRPDTIRQKLQTTWSKLPDKSVNKGRTLGKCPDIITEIIPTSLRIIRL